MSFFSALFKKKENQNQDSKQVESKLVTLIVLDGLGIHPDPLGNSVAAAKTPFLDRIWTLGRSTLLQPSGTYVGLPENEPGNSEVGHLSMGTGQVIYQSLSRINDAIAAGKFEKLEEIQKTFEEVKKRNCKFHLVGVLSAAGVHGHIEHLFALMDMAKDHGVDPYIHIITDGRDTPPTDAYYYVSKLMEKIKEIGVGKIASIGGRYYGMDRNNVWERTKKTYDAMIGLGERKATDAYTLIQECYKNGENDERLLPTTLVDSANNPIGAVSSNDVMLFYNFREDRAKQLTQVFVQSDFTFFKRENYPENLYFTTMTGYSDELKTHVIFPIKKISETLSSLISKAGMKQFHIGESEKYAHVTYFFNGGIESPHEGEDFFNIASPKVVEYSEVPEMSAYLIRDEVIKRLNEIEKNNYSFILINFANPDMVGHTGSYKDTTTACEVVDQCCRDIVKKVIELGGVCIVTADHGNAETKIDRITKKVNNQHTINPVPLIFVNSKEQIDENIKADLVKIGTGSKATSTGILSDIPSTILPILGLSKDSEMTGMDLLEVI